MRKLWQLHGIMGFLFVGVGIYGIVAFSPWDQHFTLPEGMISEIALGLGLLACWALILFGVILLVGNWKWTLVFGVLFGLLVLDTWGIILAFKDSDTIAAILLIVLWVVLAGALAWLCWRFMRGRRRRQASLQASDEPDGEE